MCKKLRKNGRPNNADIIKFILLIKFKIYSLSFTLFILTVLNPCSSSGEKFTTSPKAVI